VTFENQTSNGTAVVVNNTSLPEGGFAVIHAAAPADADNATEEENGIVTNMSEEYEPGRSCNSTYLESGDHENVTIELNESLEESQVLIAMAHQDTNDNETYEFPEADDPYIADEEPVIDDALITLEDEMNETDDQRANETRDVATRVFFARVCSPRAGNQPPIASVRTAVSLEGSPRGHRSLRKAGRTLIQNNCC